MKKIKKITSYFCVIALLTLLIGNIFSINVYAAVPDEKKAVGHNSSWGTYDFNYSFHQKYWIIRDSDGIPTSQLSAPHYFYTSDGETFFDINGGNLIQLVLTRGVGVIMDPEEAPALIRAFFAAITQHDNVDNIFVQGGVYDGQHNFLGYALNDISGCYYEDINVPSDTPALDIPSETTNNVKNFYEYYTGDTPVDFFTFYPPSTSFISKHLNLQTQNNVTQLQYANNILSAVTDNNNIYSFDQIIDKNGSTSGNLIGFSPTSGSPETPTDGSLYYQIPENCYFVAEQLYNGGQYNFDRVCHAYGLPRIYLKM